MSSYLKEKLDLKLDFNPRRAQSASAIDRPNNSPKSSKEQERPIKSADTKKVCFVNLYSGREAYNYFILA